MLLIKPNAAGVRAESYADVGGWLHRALAGDDDQESASGVRVSERNALGIPDVYKCVRVKSDAFAVLPLKVMRKINGGSEEARDHELWYLLHDAPNPRMTSFSWRRQVMGDLMINGNHYSFVERYTYNNRVRAIWPLIASNTEAFFRKDGTVAYRVWANASSQWVEFEPSEILHVYGHGFDGLMGKSPIRLHMEALGLSKAVERFGASYFGKGSRSAVIASHPGQLTKPGRERLRAAIEDQTTTAKNWHRVVVLEEGVKLEKLSIPNNEAQFIETRKFQRAEIAGIFGVPPHKIGDLERSTNNNIEHQDLEWHRDGVMPELVNFEQAANARLLTPQEQGRIYFRFEFKAQMRGDTQAQTEHLARMTEKGVYSPNECRALLGLNGYPGGDVHVMQLNMIPVDQMRDYYSKAGASAAKPAAKASASLSESDLIRAYRVPFRNEIGRVAARDQKDRRKVITGGIQALLFGMADVMQLEPSGKFGEFVERYITALSQRADAWTLEQADEISKTELERLIETLTQRSISHE